VRVVQEIVGRDAELAAVSAFLDRAGHGPAFLLLEGEPGIGKTTIWHAGLAAARERGWRVLTSRAAESEVTFSFTGLGDLLDGIEPTLPEPQAAALEVALLRREADPTADPRTIPLAFLTVLRTLAAEDPVIVGVDDVQWLDAPTARVMQFALRRLRGEPFGLLATVRAGGPSESPVRFLRDLPGWHVTQVSVGPLSAEALDRVVRASPEVRWSRGLARRLHRDSGGNPFFALEMARVAARTDLDQASGEPLPVPTSLGELMADRLAQLPTEARDVLLVAAATHGPTQAVVGSALASNRRPARAIEAALRSGVIEIQDGRIRLAHPLLASAAYMEASPDRRRNLHRRLARAAEDPEARARHLALGAEGPSEEVASSLEAAAAAARARGAPEAAADLAELAAKHTPVASPADAVRRRTFAAECAWLAGDAVRGQSLLREVLRDAEGADRAPALLLLAEITWESQSAVEAVRLAEQALDEVPEDSALRAKIHTTLAELFDFDMRRRETHAKAALALLEGQPRPDPADLAYALREHAETEINLGRPIPMDEVTRAIELQRRAPPPRVVNRMDVQLGWWLGWFDDLDAARQRLDAALRAATEEGDEGSVAELTGWLASIELRSGDWAKADLHAAEHLDLIERTGERLWRAVALARRALVDAHLGRAAASREAATEALRVGEEAPDPILEALSLWALGFLDLSVGDHRSADASLARADELLERVGVKEPIGIRFHADHIEALAALGEMERADALVRRLADRGRRAGRPWASAAALRGRALLQAAAGEVEAADRSLGRALDAFGRLGMPFDAARTLLVRGQVMRRAKRKREAVVALDAARTTFLHLPAPAWAERAAAERARVGGRPAAPDDLTETERRVAGLAAAGRTSAEIASELFLSVATVSANLTRIYRKLGVRSRTELAARLRDASAGPSPGMGDPPAPVP
jgi:DNA-binding CsgD family transcriptional regulator